MYKGCVRCDCSVYVQVLCKMWRLCACVCFDHLLQGFTFPACMQLNKLVISIYPILYHTIGNLSNKSFSQSADKYAYTLMLVPPLLKIQVRSCKYRDEVLCDDLVQLYGLLNIKTTFKILYLHTLSHCESCLYHCRYLQCPPRNTPPCTRLWAFSLKAAHKLWAVVLAFLYRVLPCQHFLFHKLCMPIT